MYFFMLSSAFIDFDSRFFLRTSGSIRSSWTFSENTDAIFSNVSSVGQVLSLSMSLIVFVLVPAFSAKTDCVMEFIFRRSRRFSARYFLVAPMKKFKITKKFFPTKKNCVFFHKFHIMIVILYIQPAIRRYFLIDKTVRLFHASAFRYNEVLV